MSKATVSTRGHIINPNCKYQTGVLLEHNNKIYDCTLNQTDISKNNNKFYIMQIIKINGKYICYIQYGRIGEIGVINYKEFLNELQSIKFFETQFKNKTGNSWTNSHNFVKQSGKYFLSEIEVADITPDNDSDTSDDEPDYSDMDAATIEFVQLISNTTYMSNSLIQLEIDTKKMPLGKISKNQIDTAFEILAKINNLFEAGASTIPDSNSILLWSSEFYTLIPYACGRQKPPIINTKSLVSKYLNLLNELAQMVYGSKTVTKYKGGTNAVYEIYRNLNTQIIALEPSDEWYKILVDYLNNSKAVTHHFNYDVLNILQIDRVGERDEYNHYSKHIDNKTLLFHGTRVSNAIGILQNGLICDLSRLGINVPITGKMFGMGVYWANSASKSIQYTAYDTSDNIACLFVAEVALGNSLKKKNADSSLTKATLPKTYHSTHGLGSSGFTDYDYYDDGTRIPAGKLRPITERKNCGLLYDEFIVYDERQICIRFAIILKVNRRIK